jgi:hypothetical protein
MIESQILETPGSNIIDCMRYERANCEPLYRLCELVNCLSLGPGRVILGVMRCYRIEYR